MSLEAMDRIALAEEKARQIRAAALQEANRILDNANAEGKAAVEAAENRARAEIRDLIKNANDKAKEEAEVLASNTRNRKAAMMARAERKMEPTVSMVVERAVKD